MGWNWVHCKTREVVLSYVTSWTKKKYIWLIREGWQCFISPSVRDEDGRGSRVGRFVFALGAFLLLLWAALQA